jgi:hypothetical protein
MGLVFVWLVSREALAGLRTWTWTRTPCEIGNSAVREGNQRGRQTGNYYFQVQYRYEFSGRSYTSDRYQLKPSSFQDYGKAARLVELYRAESAAVCFVNPSSPSDAVLERGNLFLPLLVLFPMIFVTIGAMGIYSAWRPLQTRSQVTQSMSEPAIRPAGRRVGVLFFLVFFVAGSGFFYGFFLRPLFRILSARQWPAVSCVVVSSGVRSHSDSHSSTTYSVNVLYSYEFNGREFKANRYDFMGGSSSGSRRKYDIVSRYSPGSRTFCYVNPLDPTDAVLERGFTPVMWFGLFPLVFVLAGLFGLVSTVRARDRGGLPRAGTLSAAFDFSTSEVVPRIYSTSATEPLVIKPNISPWGKLTTAIIFALFWNGIVSVFVIQILKSWRSGPFEWFLAFFMIPFVLIGLGIIVACVYFLLALFNPRPAITITPGTVRLGDSFQVEWEISGRTEVLRGLRIRLEGREEATYQSGKNTATDKNIFADIEIANVTVAQEMRSGRGNATVPGQLMHSFMGRHNKIIWAIRVHGEIARWPDVDEDFPITVLPGGST